MLKLKHTHHLDFPHITFSAPRRMQLSPVPVDDDELSQAISSYADEHDNNWELVDRPDTDQLEQYWETVVQDIKSDPEWIDFAKE